MPFAIGKSGTVSGVYEDISESARSGEGGFSVAEYGDAIREPALLVINHDVEDANILGSALPRDVCLVQDGSAPLPERILEGIVT